MGYWDATEEYLNQHGGGPICPNCGEEMFAEDDHGGFTCFCSLGNTLDVRTGSSLAALPIPQIDVSEMTNDQKAKIPGINRLDALPTEAESRFLNLLLRGGPDIIGTPEYQKACKALDKERE